MHEKINQNRIAAFKNKDYSKILKSSVKYFTYFFGYTNQPYLIETELPENVLMEIGSWGKIFMY